MISGSEDYQLHLLLGRWRGLLRPHPQLLPQRLRLQEDQPQQQERKLRDRLQDWRVSWKFNRSTIVMDCSKDTPQGSDLFIFGKPGFVSFQALCWHPRLPHCRRHGGHGPRQAYRSQDGLLLRPGGLQNVQRDVENLCTSVFLLWQWGFSCRFRFDVLNLVSIFTHHNISSPPHLKNDHIKI